LNDNLRYVDNMRHNVSHCNLRYSDIVQRCVGDVLMVP